MIDVYCDIKYEPHRNQIQVNTNGAILQHTNQRLKTQRSPNEQITDN